MKQTTSYAADRRSVIHIRSASTIYDKVKRIKTINRRKNQEDKKMLNNISIIGRLVEDPELRATKNNIPVTTFRLACGRDYVSDGERESDFFEVDAWRQTAEFVCKHFAKGQMIGVTGRLKNKSWTDKHEQKRTDTVIEANGLYFCESKPKSGAQKSGGIDPFGDSGTSAPTSPWN